MIIDKNLSQYIVFSEDSIIVALKKISDNKSGIVFSVSEGGVLEGLLTDGDFRRWLVQQNEIDLNQPVCRITNKNFKYALFGEDPDKIDAGFSDKIRYLPLLDSARHLVAIASSRPTVFRIGRFSLEPDSPTLMIAEIGNNHNGSIELAKQMIDVAALAGADCVKFQMRNLSQLYANSGNADDIKEDLGSQYVLDLLNRFQLSTQELFAAFDHCHKRNVLPLCTPWDLESLEALEHYGVEAYKIASADLTNHEFLESISRTGKPLICSTGMSTEREILEAVALFRRHGAMYALLHCNSTYPAPFKDVNLNYLDRLREIGDCPIGYSGHERGFSVPLAAVAKGAKIIEKHFTLDKTMEGNDHKISLLPDEFTAMVQAVRDLELAMGSNQERMLSQGEIINRETLAKSLFINQDLGPGSIITSEMIEIKCPGRGLQPNRKNDLIGRTARRSFKKGDLFFPADLAEEQIHPREYHFKRPWGMPVRYHDFNAILEKSNPDMLEFHLSYKDLEVDLDEFFSHPFDLDLVVHSPELFAGDHLLDLCAEDKEYRNRSIQELQRVINVTRALNPYFTKAILPRIVINCGGFSSDTPMQPSKRGELYNTLLESLSMLDTQGVEIIPQTMPPFPWHFGGQRYHNLFVNPEDTAEFCNETGIRLCLDISHSKLACNSQKHSFKDFIDEVGPHAAHLHIADAEGVDGEGLQIGQGSIDFPSLAEEMASVAPDISFIPEIWQGHKNNGEGFWTALERLERWF